MVDLSKIENITQQLLTEIGEDPSREGLIRTPHRVAKAWKFIARGYDQNLEEVLNDAIFEDKCSEMVVVRDIEFFSMCEHHMLPFFGRAHVAYTPCSNIICMSKIPRIVEMFARRLQVQERMTRQIADLIEEMLQPYGVAVVIEASHLCSMMRGVKKEQARMVTSTMLGCFKDNDKTRNEFLHHLATAFSA